MPVPPGFSIRAAARECPDRPALLAGQRSFTFAELAATVDEHLPYLRRRLAFAGQGTPPPVALVGASRWDSLIALYALLELDWPVALLHPRLTSEERRQRLEELGTELVLEESWLGDARESGNLDLVSRVGGRREADSRESPDPAEGLPAPGFRAVLFTSGTTGRPKGAVLSRAAVAAAAAASAANLGWREDDRWLLSLPIAHVGGLSVVTRCLAARRTLVLADSPRFDPGGFDRQLHRDRVTLVSLVPTMLWRLLETSPPWRAPDFLRLVLLGGAPAPQPLLEDAADRGVPVLTTYGLTEACSQVATQPPGTSNRGQLGSGPPLPGVEVEIREGEIHLRGDTLMEGYWPLADAHQPFLEGGWLPTGDLGYLDADGNLHVQGRRSDLVITGGENVHPAEVEEVLARLPGLEGACVFGVEDREWGQRIAAALVAGSGGPPTDEELSAYLRARLASFKLPRKIAYLETLPLLPNGKLDRRAAADRARARLRPLERP